MFLHAIVALFLPFFSSLFPFSTPVQPPMSNVSGVCTERGFAGSRVTRTLQSTNDTAVADFDEDGRLDFANQASTGTTLSVQFGLGNGYFGDPVVIDAFSSGFTMTSGDFNNDGHVDLLTSTKIYIGTGTGTFLAPRLLSLGVTVNQIAVGDFNGDDNLDFAGQLPSSRNVAVYYGDGIGNFLTTVTVDFLTGNINSFIVADLNADSISDLVATLAGNTAGIATGSPTGLFAPPIGVAVGGTGQADRLSAGDVDGDSDLDIVTSTQSSGTTNITTLLNNGTGSLSAQAQFTEPSSSLIRTLLADINFDNKLDYLATNSSGVIVRRFGNGDGTFQSSRRISGIPAQNRMYFADFTGDGVKDLALNSAGTPGGLSFAVLPNDGAGNFGPEQQQIMTDEGPIGIASGDFNEDGKRDVVVANELLSFWVAFGDGNGSLVDPLVIPSTRTPKAVLVADLNNDGNEDIFAIIQDASNPNAQTWTALGNGNGTFGAPIISDVNFSGFNNGRMPALLDMNRDGILDVAMGSLTNNRVAILQGFGNGGFQQVLLIDVPGVARSVVAEDLDEDGFKDLAVLTGSVSVFLNSGFFFPTSIGNFPAGNTTSHIASADFNGDSIPDLVTTTDSIGATNGNPGKAVILLGSGNGGFGAPREYLVGRGAGQMATGDFDGDGKLDLAVANSGYNLGSTGADTRVSILYGDGAGEFSRIRDFVAANFPKGIAAIDFDSDGDTDLVTPDWGQSRLSLLENLCLPQPPAVLPQLNVQADVQVTEGDASNSTIQLTVSLSAPSTVSVSVDYRTAPFVGIPGLQAEEVLASSDELTTTAAGRDYISAIGKLHFTPGETSKTIQFTVVGDTVDEFDEHVSLFLSNSINASIGDGKTLVTILDNDAPPSISVGDVSSTEGLSGDKTFNVPLTVSAISEKPITLQYVTGSGTATAGLDYRFAQSTFTLAPRQLTGSIPVAVIGDNIVEPNETLALRISDAVNVSSITDADATITIENDDIGGTVKFAQAQYSALETAGTVTVVVSRTDGTAGGVSLTFRTQAGTATPGQDYTELTRTIQFGPDETSRPVQIQILRDDLDEPDETVQLILENADGATIGSPATATLTITDVDDPPTIAISDAQLTEGSTGTSTATVFVTLSRPSQRPVSMSYTTTDVTATSPSDYQAASGVLTFSPGQTRKSLTVLANGDTVPEVNETFEINLTNAVDGSLTDGKSVVTIFNDDQSVATSLSYVSINKDGTGSGDSQSWMPSVSADGRYVAFASLASNLISSPDNNGKFDIFVRDLELGETRLVSINSSGSGTGSCDSVQPLISANGRFVAFVSCATDLANPILNPGGNAVFLRDLQTSETQVVSQSSAGAGVIADLTSISADGRFVVFQSTQPGVTATPDADSTPDVFVRDTVANVTHLVSINSAGTATGNQQSGNVSIGRDVHITPDGRYVLFPSSASDLATLPTNLFRSLYVRDLVSQTTRPVAVNTTGTNVVGTSDLGSISDDGRYVFFSTGLNSIVAGDTNGTNDVFRRDIQTGTYTQVSIGVGGVPANQTSEMIKGSPDGRYAVFASQASNLASTTDTNNLHDIYWRDLVTGETQLVTVNAAGTNSGNSHSLWPNISADGKRVVFTSTASDLVARPDNAAHDVFVRDIDTQTTYMASGPVSGLEPGNAQTLRGMISANGQVVVFDSESSNLLPNDLNAQTFDVFAFPFPDTTPRRTAYDFDGDGKADQGVFRPAEGVWYLLQSRDSAVGYGFGLAGDRLVAADYDGDRKTDPAIYREGVWWVLNSNGTGHNAIQWGIASDIPVPADYDGDGKADRAVYRDGTWWILFSSGEGFTTINWGIAGDRPVPADYDGDGKADFALYRSGEWWILFANGSGYNMVQLGTAGDTPVPADYDGDGKADPAFYRVGEWQILNSLGQTSTIKWGEPGDEPVPADYDGDGKTDPAIYRNGEWWTLLPNGYTNNTWGIPNDIPVPRRE